MTADRPPASGKPRDFGQQWDKSGPNDPANSIVVARSPASEESSTEDEPILLHVPCEHCSARAIPPALDGEAVVKLLKACGNTLAGWVRHIDGYDDAALAMAIDFVIRHPDLRERLAAARLSASGEQTND